MGAFLGLALFLAACATCGCGDLENDHGSVSKVNLKRDGVPTHKPGSRLGAIVGTNTNSARGARKGG